MTRGDFWHTYRACKTCKAPATRPCVWLNGKAGGRPTKTPKKVPHEGREQAPHSLAVLKPGRKLLRCGALGLCEREIFHQRCKAIGAKWHCDATGYPFA